MAKSKGLKIEIIAPSGVIFDDYCHMAVIPSTNGDLGIMENHEPTLSNLKEGEVNIYDNQDKITKIIKIKGGFAHNIENKLLVLADE